MFDVEYDLHAGRDRLLACNPDYCRNEKWFRMGGQSGSSPLRFVDGIAEIELRINHRAIKDGRKRENLITGLMKQWIGVVPDAKAYRFHIYVSNGKCERIDVKLEERTEPA